VSTPPRGLTPLVVAVVTGAVFAPALLNGFVDWDDNVNFLTNPHYRGLGAAQIRWMFASALSGHWIPLTWLTLGADYVVWGMNPFGYHLTSVVIHAANAVLLFLVAQRLLGRALPAAPDHAVRLGALVAALAWAVHPLRVESVAWITERRDVVSGAFALLAVLAYLRMTEREGAARRRWLALAVLAYAAGLASKSIVMGLPIVLGLLDVYPLRRGGSAWREKVPFAALAVVAAVVSLVAAAHAWALTPLEARPLGVRLMQVPYVLLFYLRKSVAPTGLSPLYELAPLGSVPGVPVIASATVVLLVAAVAGALAWRGRPALLVAGGAYLALVAPVAGIVHIGTILVADRYSYLSTSPFAILLGGAVALACRRPRSVPAAALGGTLAVWLLAMASLAWGQTQVWRSTEALWRSAIAADPACALCRSQLGSELGNRGLVGEAATHFAEAVRLRPGDPSFRRNLALALLKSGRGAEAAAHYGRLVEWRPDDAESLTRLGASLLQDRRPAEAAGPLERAVRLRPREPEARYHLARAYTELGRAGDARAQAEAIRPLDARLAEQILANVTAHAGAERAARP
jgi:Tfp pilus assembly protein PilF